MLLEGKSSSAMFSTLEADSVWSYWRPGEAGATSGIVAAIQGAQPVCLEATEARPICTCKPTKPAQQPRPLLQLFSPKEP